jgi:hypothetical protein
MKDPILPLPGLSPVLGKSVVARFDGGQLCSDAGVLVLREIEQRLRIAERLANCLNDPRAQAQVIHRLADMIRFRMLMIASTRRGSQPKPKLHELIRLGNCGRDEEMDLQIEQRNSDSEKMLEMLV